MVLVTVHSAVGKETNQVEPLPAGLGKGALQDGALRELPVLDRLVDPGQVLVDNPAGPKIEMADFRVPHLPVRQAHVQSRSAQKSLRILLEQDIVKRGGSQETGIPVFLCGRRPAGIHAPAVADHQNYR